jgi:DNA-binding LacI/PurR family transcriptional regulator
MGQLTAAKIIESIEKSKTTSNAVNLKLKTELIIRQSTAQWSSRNLE